MKIGYTSDSIDQLGKDTRKIKFETELVAILAASFFMNIITNVFIINQIMGYNTRVNVLGVFVVETYKNYYCVKEKSYR